MGQNATTLSVKPDYHMYPYRIIWLDGHVDTNNYNRTIQKQLRKLTHDLMIFDNHETCRTYLLSTLSDDRIMFIVSGQLGKILVPEIHQLTQIKSIYIYCMHKALHITWAGQFNKIEIVAEKFTEIISTMQSFKQKTIAGMTASGNQLVYAATHYCTATDDPIDNPLAFLECFVRIEANATDMNECIKYCRNVYQGNQHELELIDEFQRSYSSGRAIWWYTRQSFLYKILNKILREENIYLIYMFRFLIRDIYKQLIQCQSRTAIKVYRGQLLPDNDIVYFKTLTRKIVTIKSFLTTYLDRCYAQSSLKPPTSELKQVLFEIDASPRMNDCKPFGNIGFYSACNQEGEILFMAASNFRIDTVHCSENLRWIVRMTLVHPESSNWKDFVQRIDIMEKNTDGLNLLSYCEIIRQMGNPTRAKSYCLNVLSQLSEKDPLAPFVCFELAEIASAENELEGNRSWHKNALHFERKSDLNVKFDAEILHNNDQNSTSVSIDEDRAIHVTPSGMMSSLRFISLPFDNNEMSLPIEGYEKMPLVSLEEAILPVIDLLPNIRDMVNIAKMRCKTPADGLTVDQSAAIMLYTMEWEPSEACLYFKLNSVLRTANRKQIKPWFSYLKLILTALSHLPSKSGTFFRGVQLDLSSQHSKGDTFYWWSFSSCTTTMNILTSNQYLGSTGTRTLFAIESTSAKDISRHSYFQNEQEILLLPATHLQVVACVPFASDAHIVQLKEIKSEYSLLKSTT